MTGNRPGLYWLICWKYLSPLAMLSILVASFFEIVFEGSGYPAWVASKGVTERQEWPAWAIVLIAVLILASVLWIPAVAIFRYGSETDKNNFSTKICININGQKETIIHSRVNYILNHFFELSD